MTALIQQSTTADPLFFYLTASSDHISPLTGLGSGATVTLSKNGAAFASPAGAISEIANGWYQVAGNATDTGTLGALLLHATGTGADPCDMAVAQIVAFNPRTANLGLANLSVTSNIKKNASSRLTFTMTDSTNHNPVTGKTVAGQVSIDGGAFGALTNTPAIEISNGDYTIALAAADTNGNTLMFRFTATSSDDLNIMALTQP